MRRPVVVAVLACLVGACGPHAASAPPATPASNPAPTPADAPPSAPEAPVPLELPSDLSVPGYEVVILDPRDRGPSVGELRQGEQRFRGKDAFLRVIGVIGRDEPGPVALAAATFVDPAGAGRAPWTDGNFMGQAEPVPPSIDGNRLTYWRDHPNRPVMSVVRVDLTSGAASVSVPDDEQAPLDAAGAVAALEAAVASGEMPAIGSAVETVANVRAAGATAALQALVEKDSRAGVRRSVVDSVGRARPPGGEGVLAHALLNDADKEVRRRAARALDNWPQPQGVREALSQASTADSDPVVKAIAKRALGKLGG